MSIQEQSRSIKQQIALLELQRWQAVTAFQGSCKHPADEALKHKNDYRYHGYQDTVFCKLCGLAETASHGSRLVFAHVKDEIPLVSEDYASRYVLTKITEELSHVLHYPMRSKKHVWKRTIDRIGRETWDRYVNRKVHICSVNVEKEDEDNTFDANTCWKSYSEEAWQTQP